MCDVVKDLLSVVGSGLFAALAAVLLTFFITWLKERRGRLAKLRAAAAAFKSTIIILNEFRKEYVEPYKNEINEYHKEHGHSIKGRSRSSKSTSYSPLTTEDVDKIISDWNGLKNPLRSLEKLTFYEKPLSEYLDFVSSYERIFKTAIFFVN